MKKWKKVTITVVCIIAVLCAAGFGSYELYFKPKYAVPLAEKAAEVLKDEDLQQQVQELAQQLADDGNLDDEVLQSIMGTAEPQTENGEADDTSSDGSSESDTSSNTSPSNVSQENTSSSNTSSSSSATDTPSDSTDTSDDTSSSSDSSSSNDSSSSGDSSSSSGSTAYERITSAAMADEVAKGSAILAKVDLGTFSSLLKTDRKAAKEYLYSRLSSSEISTALQLYAKYSYLL